MQNQEQDTNNDVPDAEIQHNPIHVQTETDQLEVDEEVEPTSILPDSKDHEWPTVASPEAETRPSTVDDPPTTAPSEAVTVNEVMASTTQASEASPQTSRAASNMEVDQQSSSEPEQDEEVIEEPSLIKVGGICEQFARVSTLIKEKILSKQEPVEDFQQFNQGLEQVNQELLKGLSELTQEQRSAVIKATFGDLAEAVLAERVIQKATYLLSIFRFFQLVLVNYFPHLIKEEAFFKVVDQILDQQENLHKRLSSDKRGEEASLVDLLNRQSESLALEKIVQQSEWRQSLKPGDYLDAVKSFQFTQHMMKKDLKGWAPAKVVEADEQYLLVAFLHQSRSQDVKVERTSTYIAPQGTHTDDFNWRFDLKEDDHLDCFDDFGTWYKSIILKVEEDPEDLDVDGNPILRALVAFRFLDPDGQKEDDEGRKVTGWIMAKFNEAKVLADPVVKRFQSMTTHYFNVGGQEMKYDIQINENDELIQQSKSITVFAQRRATLFNNLQCIPDNLNSFGQAGGFENIITFLKEANEGKTQTSANHLIYLSNFVYRVLPSLTREFHVNFIPRVSEAYRDAISTDINFLSKTVSREQINGLVHGYQQMLRRMYTQKKYTMMVDYLELKIGSALLHSDLMEKRVQGIKMVSDQVKSARSFMSKATKQVVADLKKLKVFELVFQGSKFHLQIVTRAHELIRLFAQERVLSPPEVDLLWETCQRDDQARIEIFKIVADCSSSMRDEIIELFILKMKEVEPEKFSERDVKFTFDLGRNTLLKSDARLTCASVLWQIAALEKPGYNRIVQRKARKHLTDAIKQQERDVKEQYICNCIDKIANTNIQSVHSIKILLKTLSCIPKYSHWPNQQLLSQKDFVKDLVEQSDIINLLINSLEGYIQRMTAEIQGKKINLETHEFFEEGFTHNKNVMAHLNAIIFILDACDDQVDLTVVQLEKVWELLIQDQGERNDQELFFEWFLKILNHRLWLHQYLVNKFFTEKIEQNSQIMKGIQMNGFRCIQNMFLSINEGCNFINIISRPQDSEKELSANKERGVNGQRRLTSNQCNLDLSGSASKNLTGTRSKNKLEFRVHIPPKELRGVEIIWQMFQQSNQRDSELQQSIIQFLALIYQSTSRLLVDQKQRIYEEFTTECLTRLKALLDEPQLAQSTKQELVKNTMAMLKTFFEDSEKKGSVNIMPHKVITQDPHFIHELLITSFVAKEGTPKFIKLTVDSSMTVWQLIDLIAMKSNRSPLKIVMKRDIKKPEISNYDHCKSLRELNFTDKEEVSVVAKYFNSKKVPLINPLTGQLVKEAEAIFSEWFHQYSVPAAEFEDEIAKSGKYDRFMTRTTCIDFLTNTVKDAKKPGVVVPIFKVDDQRINALFEDFDSDKDGRLTHSDFLTFYTAKSLDKPDLVWQNLTNHEIGIDLLPEPRLEVNYFNDRAVTKEESELPRYLMSSDMTKLNMLFELEKYFKDNRSLETIWSLINSLKTNKHVYVSLLQGDQVVGGAEVEPSLKLLYCLQILCSFFNSYGKTKQSEATLYYATAIASEPDAYSSSFPKMGDNEPEMEDRNLGGAHWQGKKEKPQVAKDEPIALPSAAQVLKETKSGQQDGQGPAPPQNQQPKKTYNQQQIEGWKGQIVKEEIDLNVFNQDQLAAALKKEPSEDEGQEVMAALEAVMQYNSLKESWLLNFVNKGGFHQLVGILSSIVEKNKDAKTQALSITAEKECLFLVTYMIKVMLMASFCAHSQDQNSVGKLQRRLSSVKDEEMSSGTKVVKSDIQIKQEEVASNFNTMTEFLQEHDLGANLLQEASRPQFQDLLLLLFETILNKKGSIDEMDRTILAEALNIWVSCITYNSDLLKKLYGGDEASEKYLGLLVNQGLLCESQMLRNQFRDTIMFLCENVKEQGLPEAPCIFFIRVLLAKLVTISQFSMMHTAQYFKLLSNLIKKYFEMRDRAPAVFHTVFEPAQLTKSIIKQLVSYQSQESLTHSSVADNTLVGLLKLVKTLIISNLDALSKQESAEVLTMIVEKCLFTQKVEPLDSHITEGINLKELTKGSVNKCHSKKSREMAYKLLQTVTGANPEIDVVEKLLKEFWCPLIMRIPKPKYEGYSPAESKRSHYGFVGLRNLGCICYMNAMIQQFFNVPTFRYSMLGTDDRIAPNMAAAKDGHQLDDNNLHQWMRLFGHLQLTDRQEYNPIDFCYAYKEPGGAPTNVRVQQDAQEFLNVSFDRLENQLKGTSQKYLCQNVFQGQITSVIICKTCGNITQTHEDFYSISLQVKNKKNLHESMKNMVAGEIIEGYKCAKCDKPVTIEKKQAVKALPNTMILHLNRIVFDLDQMRNVKLNDKLEFPNTLNMKNYCLDNVLKNEEKAIKLQRKQSSVGAEQAEQMQEEGQVNDEEGKRDEDEEMIVEEEVQRDEVEEEVDDVEDNSNDEEFEYKLVGVVVHMGVAEAGHYISYINIERENDYSADPNSWMKTDNQTWLEFNDSNISQFDFKSNLAKKCFGEDQVSHWNQADDGNNLIEKAHNAYMLVYEKKIKKPIRVVLTKEDVEHVKLFTDALNPAQLAEINTLIGNNSEVFKLNQSSPSKNNSELALGFEDLFKDLSHCFKVYPGLLQKIMNKQFVVDEANSEIYAEVPFHEVQKFVPKSIYHEVHDDNQTFLVEQQVFCGPFFKTTVSLLQSVDQQKALVGQSEPIQQQEDFMSVYRLLDKLIFDLIISSDENKNIKEITDMMFRVLKAHPEAMETLLKERVMFEQPSSSSKKPELPFFDRLIFHRSQEIRELIESILTFIVKTSFEKLENPNLQEQERNDIYKEIDGIMNCVTALFPVETQKAWLKLGALFKFFYELVEDRQPRVLQYMYDNNVVRLLIDLISRYSGNNAYGYGVNPPFDMAVKVISILSRSTPFITYMWGMDNDYQATYEEQFTEFEKVGESPFYLKPAGEWDLLFMAPTDMQALMMDHARHKKFWEIVLNYKIESKEMAKLIGHVCWKDYNMSRKLAKVILNGLNQTSAEDIPPFATAMDIFLSIEDEYQNIRLEWILGLAEIVMERTQQQMYNNDYRLVNNRVGANRINDIADKIYVFNTPLWKEITGTKESVLQMMYSYRKDKFQMPMLVISDQLLETMASTNKNKAILKYILSMEPPAYTCRRYWDWIEPYLIEMIQTCTDQSGHSHTAREELEFCLRMFSNIEKMKQENPELFEMTDGKELLGRYIPEAYLMWDVVSEQDVTTVHSAEKQIDVVVTELVVNTGRSKPTGDANECLTRVVSGFNTRFKQRKNKKGGSKKQSPQVGRSRGRGSRSYAAKQGHQPLRVKKTKIVPAEEAIDADDEEPIVSFEPEKDAGNLGGGNNSDGNWSDKVNNINSDNEFDPEAYLNNLDQREGHHETNDHVPDNNDNEGYEIPHVDEADNTEPAEENLLSEAPQGEPVVDEDMVMQEEDNLGFAGVQADSYENKEDGSNNTENPIIEDTEVEQEPQQEATANFGSDRDVDDEMAFEDPDAAVDQQQEEEEFAEDMKQELMTILVVLLRNFNRQKAQTITIKFPPEVREKLNFRSAEVEHPCQVSAQTDKTFWKYSKLRPMADWGPLQFEVIVDEETFSGKPYSKYQRNFPELRQLKQSLQEAAQAQNNDNEPEYQEGYQDMGGDLPGEDFDSNIKECPFCTYHNMASASECAVCESQI